MYRIGSSQCVCLAMILSSLGTATVAGQIQKTAAKAPGTWTVPRTPNGQPDLQGTWTNGTLTPFERPAALGDKAFLTEEEAAAQESQAAARRANPPVRRPGDVGNDNEAFVDTGYKITSTRQTSLVVDPPDGRVQFLPEAEKRR